MRVPDAIEAVEPERGFSTGGPVRVDPLPTAQGASVPASLPERARGNPPRNLTHALRAAIRRALDTAIMAERDPAVGRCLLAGVGWLDDEVLSDAVMSRETSFASVVIPRSGTWELRWAVQPLDDRPTPTWEVEIEIVGGELRERSPTYQPRPWQEEPIQEDHGQDEMDSSEMADVLDHIDQAIAEFEKGGRSGNKAREDGSADRGGDRQEAPRAAAAHDGQRSIDRRGHATEDPGPAGRLGDEQELPAGSRRFADFWDNVTA